MSSNIIDCGLRNCTGAEDVCRYATVGTSLFTDADRFPSDAIAVFITDFGANGQCVAEIDDIDLAIRNLSFFHFTIIVVEIPSEAVV